jgi:hypothetical protein
VELRITNGTCVRDTSMTVLIGNGITPVITSSGRTSLCAGDSIVLDAGAGYAVYGWSTGENTQRITIWQSGLYRVTVTDTSGCAGADSIRITAIPAPTPLITGTTSLCEGDSAILDAGALYVSYDWSDGNKSRFNRISKAGAYSVVVTDANGCTGVSPSHLVTSFPKPSSPTITRSGDTLFSSIAQAYQWFRNDSALSDGTVGNYTIKLSGVYKVRITDSNGCRAESDTVGIILDINATATIQLPVFEASPGDHVTIPMNLLSSQNLDKANVTGFTTTLRFNKTLLFPTGQTPLGVIDKADRLIQINNPKSTIQDPLVTLDFIAMLGDADQTPLHFESFDWNGAPVRTTLLDGEVRIKVCREGGTRLFSSGGKVQLFQNRPNPFNAQTVIRYEVIERAQTQLYVMDILGRRVATLVDEVEIPGLYDVLFDASYLASGLYFSVLRTPSITKMRPMQIEK